MTQFWLVLLGSGLSILGGLLAVWYQQRRTAALTRKLRREERQETAVIKLLGLLPPLEEWVGRLRSSHENDPDSTRVESFWPSIRDNVEALKTQWDSELSSQVYDGGVQSGYAALQLDWQQADIIRVEAELGDFWSVLQQFERSSRNLREKCRKLLLHD